jgi:UDP-N-acetylmuramoyl-L-alanyl-D-glutamate--2,6-diaminopimelate ligase
VLQESDKENYGRRLAAELDGTSPVTVGFGEGCAIRARECTQDIHGISCEFVFGQGSQKISSKMTGSYNILNMLAAAGAAQGLNIPIEQIGTGLSGVGQVPGRLERVTLPGLPEREMPSVFVDYAHTPDALENVLRTINSIRSGNEQLITVVGAGGDRDKSKRPLMGNIAGQLSTRLILTSDNPRSEDPEEIIREMKEVVAGIDYKKLLVITNRKEAISTACALAGEGDIILVAGKGHEKYQEIKGVRHPFDDKKLLEEILIQTT